LKPTKRGYRVILAILTTLLLSLLFGDHLITLISIVLGGVMLYGFINFLQKLSWSKRLSIEPRKVEKRIMAGEVGVMEARLESPIDVKLIPPARWVALEKPNIRKGFNLVKFTLSPKLSGKYIFEAVEAEVEDKLGLFSEKLSIPFNASIIVYPRPFPWIVEGLRLMSESTYGVGDVPGRLRGRGLEYLWSRVYEPGDPLDRMDWKATARRLLPMIKETLQETYSSLCVIHDVRSHGRYTADQLAASFLSAVVTASKLNVPISITMKKGDETLLERTNLDPSEALKISLSYVIETYITPNWNIYELFEPKSTREIARMLQAFGSKGLWEAVVGLKGAGMLRAASKFLEVSGGVVVYVGCILVDSGFVIELADRARARGVYLVVLTPDKPWADAGGLEEAYLMHLSYVKVTGALERMGAVVTRELRMSSPLTMVG